MTLKLGEVNAKFKAGDVISRESLIKAKMVKTGESRYGVKILGGGEIDKSLKFDGVLMTNPVKEAILKAGGEVK